MLLTTLRTPQRLAVDDATWASLTVTSEAIYQWLDAEVLDEIERGLPALGCRADGDNQAESLRSLISRAYESFGRSLLTPVEQRSIYLRATKLLAERTILAASSQLDPSGSAPIDRTPPQPSSFATTQARKFDDARAILARLRWLTSDGRH